jgi:hypothetical protein
LISERRLALQQMDRLRTQLKEIESEIAFFSSHNAREQIEAARLERERAVADRRMADERLTLAIKSDLAEKEGDQFAAHISAILEHGEAIGLQAGHCPLCDAARTPLEFAQAIAPARTRLATRGERLAATAAVVSGAKAELEKTEQTLASANDITRNLRSAVKRSTASLRRSKRPTLGSDSKTRRRMRNQRKNCSSENKRALCNWSGRLPFWKLPTRWTR